MQARVHSAVCVSFNSSSFGRLGSFQLSDLSELKMTRRQLSRLDITYRFLGKAAEEIMFFASSVAFMRCGSGSPFAIPKPSA